MAEVLLAPAGASTLEDACARAAERARARPFDGIAVDFVATLSSRLLADPELRALPDLVAFAYWMRRSRLEELRRRFESTMGGDVAAARGLVLHYAPSNVDTIFAYSWLLSVLAGNANVVRLSQRRDRTAEVLLGALREVLASPTFEAVRERTVFVSFEHDRATNARLGAACDLRVIWGGDGAIRAIREAPLRPWATDVVFPDRFSMAVFDAATIVAMDAASWDTFLRDFANDVFVYGQMACSSPRHIAWVGPAEICEKARLAFWERFRAVADARPADEWAQPVSGRLTAACRAAMRGARADLGLATPLTVARVERLTEELREMHPGGGFFFEADYATLDDLRPDVVSKDQTLVALGFSRDALAAFAAALPRGGADRIVPVGRALEFSHVWDGQDLLQTFTRRVVVTV
ncbi:MAG TPA: acyl-CoA reductase [Candidatus Polarisedimenticolaceae bacterium]